MQRKKLKIIIAVLAFLLAVSLAALIGTLVVKCFYQHEAASVEVPGNIITPDDKDSSDTDKDKPSDSTIDPSDGNNTTDPRETHTPESSQSTDQSANTSASESVPTPTAPESTGAASVSGTKASAIALYNRKPEENKPFQVTNMFPGDAETKYFRIKVSYKGDIIVRYHADIRLGYEKLAEVLKVKVRLLGSEGFLYDGLMRDMPKSLNHALYTNTKTQSELYYEITAYLDTSVGNEYQDKDLIADFRWWVEETNNLDSPQTGDDSNIYLWTALAAGSLFCIVILLAKRRKETNDEN